MKLRKSSLKTIVAAGFAGAAFLAAAAAHADITKYHLVWTAQAPADVTVNDYHIDISYEQPATVIAPHNFWKGAFNRVRPVTEAGSISVHWDQPGVQIFPNQAMIIGFDFAIDKPFTIDRLYWTLDGRRVADGDITEIEIVKVTSNESFEEYQQGHLPGQGHWQSFFNDPQFGDFNVVDFIGANTPNAIEIDQMDNAVHSYEGFDAPVWMYQAWQFVPGDFQSGGGPNDPGAGSWFFLFNTYDDGTNTAIPSVATRVNSWDQTINLYVGDPNNVISVPYIVDQWVPIDVVIDLDNDHTQVFYDGQFIAEYSWTAGAFGDNSGQPQVAAVGLWANGSSPVFYDDLILEMIPIEAELKLVKPLIGSITGGGIPELFSSDDQYLTTQSGFGSTILDSTLIDLHSMELRGVFDIKNAEMIPPFARYEVAAEVALPGEPAGRMELFVFDHDMGEFEMIGRGQIGLNDFIIQAPIDPQRHIAPNGRVDVMVRQVVLVPFFAFQFDSRIDLLECVLDVP